MNLALLFIAGQVYENAPKTLDTKEACSKGEKHSKSKRKKRPSIESVEIKPQMTRIVSYNQYIDEQFVEDVMSDIEQNWSAVDRGFSPPQIRPVFSNESSTSIDSKYIMRKYNEIEQFHSDVTVSCESDLDSIIGDELIIEDLMDDLECDVSDSEHVSSAAALCDIQKHLVQRYSENGNVFFDQIAVSKGSNSKICLLDSKGLTTGHHQWQIQILQTDVDLQEIGVISINDITGISISNDGIRDTAQCKSRCVYGNELSSFSSYIASSNEDGSDVQDLSQQRRIGWCVYDTITVDLDLEAWTIRFLLNDKQCGEMVQLQRETYYPVLSFAGRCRYDLR